MKMGIFSTRENVFKMSATWEYVTIKYQKTKIEVDFDSDNTVISSFLRSELGKSQLDRGNRRLEPCNGHQLTLLGSPTCDVEWNGSNYMQQQIAVWQSDKEFGLFDRNICTQEGICTVCDEKLSEVKVYKAHVTLMPGSQPMFYKARKIPLPLRRQGQRKT